jgi:putative FmdB family regulatory protein
MADRRGGVSSEEGGYVMPRYEFFCETCDKEVSMVLSIGEREGAQYTCPGCGGKALRPLLAGFFAKTSRKS